MSHPSKISPATRLLLVKRIEVRRGSIAQLAEEVGVSRATAWKWWRRYQQEGEAGMYDRSSRPHSSPLRTPEAVDELIVRVRKQEAWGPQRIAHYLGVAASTVYAVLKRHGLNCLHCLNRTTREPMRYERQRPGELLHLDIKKLGRIPDGGGWPFQDEPDPAKRGPRKRQKLGYEYLHLAIDDHTRLAYGEVLPNEQGFTSAGFLRRSVAHFAKQHGVAIERVLTDNGPGYHSRVFCSVAAELGLSQKYTRPYRPQTNGKAEALVRIAINEWAYRQVYSSNLQRLEQLPRFLEYYNYHRPHGGIGNQPPIARLSTT